MAQKVEVEFVDDIDGQPAEGTVSFALEGKAYEIDLSPSNKAELHNVLARFIDNARKAGKAPKAATSVSRGDRAENQAIREWANKHGMSVSTRGRIPAEVLERYNSRQSKPSPTPRNGQHEAADVTMFQPAVPAE